MCRDVREDRAEKLWPCEEVTEDRESISLCARRFSMIKMRKRFSAVVNYFLASFCRERHAGKLTSRGCSSENCLPCFFHTQVARLIIVGWDSANKNEGMARRRQSKEETERWAFEMEMCFRRGEIKWQWWRREGREELFDRNWEKSQCVCVYLCVR